MARAGGEGGALLLHDPAQPPLLLLRADGVFTTRMEKASEKAGKVRELCVGTWTATSREQGAGGQYLPSQDGRVCRLTPYWPHAEGSLLFEFAIATPAISMQTHKSAHLRGFGLKERYKWAPGTPHD